MILLRDAALFVDDMGVSFPVVQWLDADGNDTDDRATAVVCIAGANNIWWTLTLAAFPLPTLH